MHRPRDLAASLSAPARPAAVRYSLRWGAHNGRTFVGPLQQAGPLRVAPNLGSLVLEPNGPLLLEWLLADVLTVVVLQLLAAPAQVCGALGARR